MKNILCYLFGHKYQAIKKLSFNCHKLKCKRCDKKFAINHDMKVVLEWDLELEQLHEFD